MTYRPFTLIIPYYENPAMFREQQRQWRALPEDVRAALHVIVVDDGSPTAPALPEVHPATAPAIASFRLFRTGVDVRWNWLFCRNLGVDQATTEWVLMTDMDHVIPNVVWRKVMRDKLNPLFVYRLSRVSAPAMARKHPHPNTWALTRHMFLNRIGGYDERFSGHYGTDGEFTRRVEDWAQKIVILPEAAIEYGSSVIADASTTRYTRKEDFDRENVTQIRRERAALVAWSPKRLTFPWTQLL